MSNDNCFPYCSEMDILFSEWIEKIDKENKVLKRFYCRRNVIRLREEQEKKDVKYTFEERIEQLCAFKHDHGHTQPTCGMKEFRSLAFWVKRMRYLKRKGRLDQKKVAQLDGIGFQWKTSRANITRTYKYKFSKMYESRIKQFNSLNSFMSQNKMKNNRSVGKRQFIFPLDLTAQKK